MANRPEGEAGRSKAAAGRSENENLSTSTSFTLMSQILGSSLLSVAYVYARIGFVLSFILLPLSLAIALLLIIGFVEACYLTRSFSYRSLTQKVISLRVSYVLDVMLIVLYFGYLTGYIIIASQSIVGILGSFVPDFDNYKWAHYAIKTLITLVIIFPMSMLTSTKTLSAIASVSIFFAITMAITIPIYYFISLWRNGQVCPRFPAPTSATDTVTNNGLIRSSVPWWPSESKGLNLSPTIMGVLFFISYIPMLQGNFTAQLVVPPMLEMLKGPMYLRMRVLKLSITIALCFCAVLYAIAGFFGGLNFGKKTQPNILSSFDVCNDYWIAIIKVLYALVVCVAYPLLLYPIKLSIMSYIKIDRAIESKRWYAIFAGLTVAFIVLCLAFALGYENIATIFGLLGSLCGAVLFFGVPIWVCYKLPALRAQSQANINQEFIEAADEHGIVETEAVGTSVLALMLPGNVKEALTRARSISNTVPVDVNTVELQVSRSRGVSMARRGSLIGFLRGRSLSSAFNASDAQLKQDMASALPESGSGETGTSYCPDTGAPLAPGRERTGSFMVNVSVVKPGSRQGSISMKSRHGSMAMNASGRRASHLSPTQRRNTNNGEAAAINTVDHQYDNVKAREDKPDCEFTESTEEESSGTKGIPDILPAVAEVNQAEIGAICGIIDKDKEIKKMTKCRKVFAWTCIVISVLVCVESFCINIIDFIGKLD